MPNIPASITQLQARNVAREFTNENVTLADSGLDYQNIDDFILPATTVVEKPKEETVFETVLPEVQRELIVKYDNNLTKVSNYTYVHERDDAGNIVFTENSIDNQLLVIEPITYRYETEFINKTINTRFSYFRFPATSIASVDVPQLTSIDNNFNTAISQLSSYAQNETDRITGAGKFDNFEQAIQGVRDPSFAADLITDAINAAPFNDTDRISADLIQSITTGTE